jgi:hypothetical protein
MLRGLLGALEQRWKGSVVVRYAAGLPATVLLLRSGHVVAGRLHGVEDLFDAVFSLCESDHHADISFASNVDLVGSGPWVTQGTLDTLALTAAVVRGADSEASVHEALSCIGGRPIIIRANIAFDRYAFSRAERAVVDILDRGPLTLPELERCSGLPRSLVERVVFTLWITRAVNLAPTWLRSVSGPISSPAPALDQNSHEDETVVMKSFVRRVGSYSQRAPANGVMGLWDETEQPAQAAPSPPADDSPQARADEHFRLAELLLEHGHAREAVFQAQKALRLCRPRPDQRALYAWALYQRGGAGPNVPAHVWEHIDTALLEDARCPTALHYHALLLSSQSQTASPTSRR